MEFYKNLNIMEFYQKLNMTKIEQLRIAFENFLNLHQVKELLENSVESCIKITYNNDNSIVLDLQVEKKEGHSGYRKIYK